MNNVTSINRVDPHIGRLRDDSRDFYRREDAKANTFMAVGVCLILVAGYLGYLLGKI